MFCVVSWKSGPPTWKAKNCWGSWCWHIKNCAIKRGI